MKHLKYISLTLFIGLLFGMTACSDFLDKYPKDEQTEETAFKTYENFELFSWKFYDVWGGYPTGGGYLPSNVSSEYDTDNMINAQPGQESEYAYQKKIVPASDGGWSFGNIRRVNLMLQNIDKSDMSQAHKDHWRSVGYFFRAVNYYSLFTKFGALPWIDKVLSENDEAAYGSREPREVIAKNILDDLLWAEEHIITYKDQPNVVNVNTVRALMSRFTLFEGTWRKYHGGSDADLYLNECVRVSKLLIDQFPTIMNNYHDKYNSEDLVGKPGIILAKQYAAPFTVHSIGRVIRTSAWYADLTKDAVDSYLCTDGKPITTSSLYDGDKGDYAMYDQFRNRDRRLYLTVIPPYKVKLKGNAGQAKEWEYDSDPKHREYIDLINEISGGNEKSLPVSNFNVYHVGRIPHFREYPDGQGFIASRLGYYFWKYYNLHKNEQALQADEFDFPIYTIEEVMLNYAEAMFELSKFDQGVADLTINKLRVRANISKMIVSDIDASFDPARDPLVEPILWEIRRERRVELMGDGFRFNDLKRWKKGNYVDKRPIGVWINNNEFGNKLNILGGGSEGNVVFFGTPLGWLDKYYLEPIPSKEFILNPNLAPNNPGWDVK